MKIDKKGEHMTTEVVEKKKRRTGLSGMMIDFTSVKDITIEQLFEGQDISKVPVTQIMKKIWELIKTRNLKVPKAPKNEQPPV